MIVAYVGYFCLVWGMRLFIAGGVMFVAGIAIGACLEAQ